MKIVGAKCNGCGKQEQMQVDHRVMDVLPPGWVSRQLLDTICIPATASWDDRRVEGEKLLLHYCVDCQPGVVPAIDPELLAYVKKVQEQRKAEVRDPAASNLAGSSSVVAPVEMTFTNPAEAALERLESSTAVGAA